MLSDAATFFRVANKPEGPVVFTVLGLVDLRKSKSKGSRVALGRKPE